LHISCAPLPLPLSRAIRLSQLEGDVAVVADDLRADLDQLLAEACQRPRPVGERIGTRVGQGRRVIQFAEGSSPVSDMIAEPRMGTTIMELSLSSKSDLMIHG
jgi:hypothetical protein